METALLERGASPRRLLWASISRATERERSPSFDDSDLFEEETESLPRYLKELPGSRDHKKDAIMPLAQSSRNFVRPCLMSVPNVVAEIVTAAHYKLLQDNLMCCTYQNGLDCTNGNAETIVGSDGLLSASVDASSRCLHVQLQGMEVLQQYFVSVDVQINEETSGSSDDVSSYVALQPNLLDGFGWAKSTLHLDLSAHLKERLRSSSFSVRAALTRADIRYQATVRILKLSEDCWPVGAKPVLIHLREGFVHELLSDSPQTLNHPVVFPYGMEEVSSLGDRTPVNLASLGPYSLPSPTTAFRDSCPWQEGFDARGTCGQNLLQRGTLADPVAVRFGHQEKVQHPRFHSVIEKGFTSEIASCDDDFPVDRGQATFFRDLESEALLRLIHLDQRRPLTTLPPRSRWPQHRRCPCDEGHPAVRFGVGICEEDVFEGRNAWPSAEPRFF
ncbi:uncharacterized protein LOC142581805 [Dermacentor variabilis]|uniref:uncharacterized protein LOC142581805 n=1 Tax=Dermacentor variabilis TaxID=34621 RepID=UPI003F5C79C6